jgi:hypothetical protein
MSEVFYGESSLAVRSTLRTELVEIFDSLLTSGIDHSLICGFRNEYDQNALYYADPPKTQLKWPHSKHNHLPSDAVDAVPYIRIDGLSGGIHWNKESIINQGHTYAFASKTVADYVKQMCFFAGIVIERGRSLGYSITWGGDWDRDWSVMDNVFNDLPHYQFNGVLFTK